MKRKEFAAWPFLKLFLRKKYIAFTEYFNNKAQ